MPPKHEPKVHTNHREVLAAIRRTPCLAELTHLTKGHYDYELDLEIVVYGRDYHDKPVGPYARLLTYAPETMIIRQGEEAGNYFYVIVEGQVEVCTTSTGQAEPVKYTLPAGEQFGVTSMLAGERRRATVTASAQAPVQLLEISRPAVRLLRKLPRFNQHLESTYRRHSKTIAIDELMQKTGISGDLRSSLEAVCDFKVLSKNHVLFDQDTFITQLFIIREGWVKRHRQLAKEELTDFLGKGYCLGLEGARAIAQYPYSATVEGMTEALEINLIKLRQNKQLNRALIDALNEKFPPPSVEKKVRTYDPQVRDKAIAAQEKLIDTGIVDGHNLLVMDMELCVRCGNCSMACHQVHDQSRLTRRGIHLTRIEPLKSRATQSLLVPAVCMHCKDPECLAGCPTGAITRFTNGRIDIVADMCIGCGDCATQCPYDAIAIQVPPEKNPPPDKHKHWRLWERLGFRSEPVLQPTATIKAPLAIKCDLCHKCTSLNPSAEQPQVYSCELNCPTGALVRISAQEYLTEIGQLQNPQTTAPIPVSGHNIHKADPPRRWIHLGGITLALAIAALIYVGLRRYGYATPLIGRLNLRWLTGIGGVAGVLGALVYQRRRRIYDKRYGPLRYWMLVHMYLGVTACLIILLHAGTSSRTMLTQSLAVAFDLVIGTGLLGVALYRYVPRLLTRIEDVPLLMEDLQERREELKNEITVNTGLLSEPLKRLVKKKVLSWPYRWRLRLRQYGRREDLKTLRASATQAFAATAEAATTDEQERRTLAEVVAAAATLARVRTLVFLHALLKTWLVAHLIFTYSMLTLMVVHIVQVLYTAW